MLFEPNIPNFDGFGVIANSDFPIPEAFIIKDIANQNTINNSFNIEECKYNSSLYHNSYYNYYNSLGYEEDEENNNYNKYNDYEEEEYDE